MLDMLTRFAGPAPPAPWGAPLAPRRPADTASTLARWYELMLDEIDYGVLLLDADAQLLHMNRVARHELDDARHPLLLLGRQLGTRDSADRLRLHAALQAATQQRLRRLLLLGQGANRVAVPVVPLASGGPTTPTSPLATQLSLGKRQMCGELAVQWFARSHDLTLAETRVLGALSEGLQPSEIAARFGVGLSTIRSQIASIRLKTHCDSIGAVVRQVAALPPLVGALRGGALQPVG